MIKAVLFDMDGVLLDSEDFITLAGMQMFKEKGYNVKYEDFKEFTGMGEDRFLGGVAEKYNIRFDAQKDKTRAYEIYKQLVEGRLQPLPGVKSFLNKCRNLGLKTAVATSADEVKMFINLRETGLATNDFDASISGSEVKNKKPHPEVFLKAAAKLGIPAENCLVVEDALSGVEAAKAAGCKCLALTTSFSASRLNEADWIAADLSNAPEACLNW